MSEELKQAAQQALELLRAHTESAYCQAHDREDQDVIAALEAILVASAATQHPAAQATPETVGSAYQQEC